MATVVRSRSQDEAQQQLISWKEFLVKIVRSERHDLTERQFAVLLIVYLDDPPHTVRGLAARLNISKPAITRALDRLADFNYIRRKQDPLDRRSVLVQQTIQGDRFLTELRQLIRED